MKKKPINEKEFLKAYSKKFSKRKYSKPFGISQPLKLTNMTKRKLATLSELMSDCCNAEVKSVGQGDFHDKDEVCTRHFECEGCGKACNSILKPKKQTKKPILGKLYNKAYDSGYNQGKSDTIKKIEEWANIQEDNDGKEWIAMMENARGAGFSNMISPRDFIGGRQMCAQDLKQFLNKMKHE